MWLDVGWLEQVRLVGAGLERLVQANLMSCALHLLHYCVGIPSGQLLHYHSTEISPYIKAPDRSLVLEFYPFSYSDVIDAFLRYN
jgi:hypothetical protein